MAGPGARTVLITRPEPGAGETAARVAALGFSPVLAPLLRIEPRSARLPPASAVAAILVTSGNALDGLAAAYRALPLLTVGSATARRARDAGFSAVESADGDAEALQALVRRRFSPDAGTLLLASGARQGLALAGALRCAGFRVLRRVLYVSVPAARLPEPAAALLRHRTPHVVLFFSTETAETYVGLVRRASLDSAVADSEAVTIGEAVSVALRSLPWRRVRVAPRPNQDEMLALLQ